MAQEHKNKSTSKRKDAEEVAPEPQQSETKAELDEVVEDLLADIDDVLEEDAQAFVNSFIQKGGQ